MHQMAFKEMKTGFMTSLLTNKMKKSETESWNDVLATFVHSLEVRTKKKIWRTFITKEL